MPKKSAAYTSQWKPSTSITRRSARSASTSATSPGLSLPAAAPAPAAPLPVGESRSEPSPAARSPRLFMRASVRTTFAESFARPARSSQRGDSGSSAATTASGTAQSETPALSRRHSAAPSALKLTVKRSEPSWKPICSTMPTRVLCRGSRNSPAQPNDVVGTPPSATPHRKRASKKERADGAAAVAQPAMATPASTKKSAASQPRRAATRPHRKRPSSQPAKKKEPVSFICVGEPAKSSVAAAGATNAIDITCAPCTTKQANANAVVSACAAPKPPASSSRSSIDLVRRAGGGVIMSSSSESEASAMATFE